MLPFVQFSEPQVTAPHRSALIYGFFIKPELIQG